MGIYLEKSTALAPFPNPSFPLVVTVNVLLIAFFQESSKSNLLFILDLTVASFTLVEAPKEADKLFD